MRTLLALTRAGFREAIRNRVTVVVALFAIVMILLTTVVLNVTVFSLDRVVTDFGLGVMSLILVGLSIFMSVGMISREIERRTVFLTVSRPLSRTTFVVGRYLGMVATLTVLLVAMSVIYGTQIILFEVPPHSSMAVAIVGLWFELLVLSSMGLFFSTFAGPITSTICVVSLYLVGHWMRDLFTLSTTLPPGLSALARGAYYALPNLDRLDFRAYATYSHAVEASEVLTSGGIAVAWSVLFLGAASLIFDKRDFK